MHEIQYTSIMVSWVRQLSLAGRFVVAVGPTLLSSPPVIGPSVGE